MHEAVCTSVHLHIQHQSLVSAGPLFQDCNSNVGTGTILIMHSSQKW